MNKNKKIQKIMLDKSDIKIVSCVNNQVISWSENAFGLEFSG